MYALVDCNNFFCSCERVFNPAMMGRPVVVLSNNDGCVIARSNEAKKIGIPMGIPAYQIEAAVVEHNIGVFSSNYTLYGDMSNRVMNILAEYARDIEVYSIDEAFLDLNAFKGLDYASYGREIARAASKGTGIPISIGIAPTKTLAKIANKFAKKVSAYKSVCVIDTDEKRIKALKLTKIEDVWGIGRRYSKKLRRIGINTAYDFSLRPERWVKKGMTVVGQRMWNELNGIPMLGVELEPEPKKQICTSRSFGQATGDIAELEAAVARYASLCAEKVRRQKALAVSMLVFVETNPFREDLPQYFRSKHASLQVPTNCTLEIAKCALGCLRRIFPSETGYVFKKAGVIITEIVPGSPLQLELFDKTDRERQGRLMSALDNVNRGGFYSDSIRLGVEHTPERKYMLRREKLSRCFTTDINQIMVVKTG